MLQLTLAINVLKFVCVNKPSKLSIKTFFVTQLNVEVNWIYNYIAQMICSAVDTAHGTVHGPIDGNSRDTVQGSFHGTGVTPCDSALLSVTELARVMFLCSQW